MVMARSRTIICLLLVMVRFMANFLLPLIFPLLHVAYGVGTLVGLLQIPFWRRKIKNSHAKEHIEKVKRKIKENTRK